MPMTEFRKQRLLKTLEVIRRAVRAHDHAGAVSSSALLTAAGYGVPAFSPAYWHAKRLQHELYYYGTWIHSLAGVPRLIRLIGDETRRIPTEESATDD